MPQLTEMIWEPDATYGYSRRDSKPFRYHAFIPDRIADLDPVLPASVTATIEAAATAAVELDRSPGIEDLEPIARLLLRAESVASSRIEDLRISHRRLEKHYLLPKQPGGPRSTWSETSKRWQGRLRSAHEQVSLSSVIFAIFTQHCCRLTATGSLRGESAQSRTG